MQVPPTAEQTVLTMAMFALMVLALISDIAMLKVYRSALSLVYWLALTNGGPRRPLHHCLCRLYDSHSRLHDSYCRLHDSHCRLHDSHCRHDPRHDCLHFHAHSIKI